jgi:hypothetical protein
MGNTAKPAYTRVVFRHAELELDVRDLGQLPQAAATMPPNQRREQL